VRWEILAGLDADDERRLLAAARRRRFARHEVVFHRGDPADSVHLVTKGRFAARIVTPLGDSAMLSVVGPGQAFGELALLGRDAARSATIAALEPGETLALRRADFEALRASHAEIDAALIDLLADHVRRLSDRLVEALYVPADRRVLRHLLRLEAVYGNGDGALVPLTQEDLASLAGTSRATVNRVLREAEQRGEVRLARGRTSVLDREALRRRAGVA
jgi:CRP/FNR family cyclic AMP-dependent transcriptional regulator